MILLFISRFSKIELAWFYYLQLLAKNQGNSSIHKHGLKFKSLKMFFLERLVRFLPTLYLSRLRNERGKEKKQGWKTNIAGFH